MRVENAEDLNAIIKGSLITNPIKTALAGAIKDHKNTSDYLFQLKEENQKSQEKIERNTKFISVQQQLKRKFAHTIVHLEKAVISSQEDASLEWMTADKFETFFKQSGMEFVGLAFPYLGETATLTYIRPAKNIGSLPVPPLIISIHYATKLGNSDIGTQYAGTLVFDKVKVYSPLGHNLTYIHPHISSGNAGSICLGNFLDVFEAKSYSLTLEGYQEQVILLDNLLSTYNPDSPYRSLEEILLDCVSIGYRVDKNKTISLAINNSDFVLSNNPDHEEPGLNMLELVGRARYEKFYELLTTISVQNILEDLKITFENLSFDDERDSHDYLTTMHEKITKLFKNNSDLEGKAQLTCPSYYETCDEESDSYIIDSDGFDDVVALWVEELGDFSETEFAMKGFLSVNNLIPLDNIFEEAEEEPLIQDEIPF